ncbi:flagellar assembly protein FliH [bacterium LRH843]|nr:flagellar assembly protein FliH [bacterium LRH843]
MSKIIKSPHAITRQSEPAMIKVRNLFEEPEMKTDDHQKLENTSSNIKSATEVMAEIEQKLHEAEKHRTEIMAEAEKYAAEAREQLQVERKQAESEIEQAIITGREQGYNDGFMQGELDGRKTYEQLIGQAGDIIRNAEEQFEKTIDSAGPVIVEMSVALVNRIVGRSLEVDSETWSSMLAQVMAEVREHEDVKLYVHPDWYTKTSEQKEELEQLLSRTEKLYIYPDAGLPENGCIVESKYGRIDATLDRQLHELKSQLLEKWSEGSNAN